jgi:hypothetical protein
MTYTPQGLAAGGPSVVYSGGGYRHGMCGNAHTGELIILNDRKLFHITHFTFYNIIHRQNTVLQ